MRRRRLAGALAGLLALAGPLGVGPARAADFCANLTKLLTEPADAYPAMKGRRTDAQFWEAKPFLDGADCQVWSSPTTEAHNIRCTASDGATPATVTAFYEATRTAIDRCLAASPAIPRAVREARAVDTAGLKGAETEWVIDGPARRFRLQVTDFRRVVLGSAYNSLSFEYLKY